MGMVAHHRAEGRAAAAHLAHLAGAPDARPAGPLLAVALGVGRADDLAAALGLACPARRLAKLPVDGARQDVPAQRHAENLFVELDLAGPSCSRGS